MDTATSQKVKDREAEDPEFLRSEVNRLEGKVTRLNSAVEAQGKELKEVNEEVPGEFSG